jgi:hypothetical protein
MKAKILRITDEIILDLIGPGIHEAYECVENPLPGDAHVTGMDTDFTRPHELWLRIESETFSEVETGMLLEFLEPPVFRKIRKCYIDE